MCWKMNNHQEVRYYYQQNCFKTATGNKGNNLINIALKRGKNKQRENFNRVNYRTIATKERILCVFTCFS